MFERFVTPLGASREASLCRGWLAQHSAETTLELDLAKFAIGEGVARAHESEDALVTLIDGRFVESFGCRMECRDDLLLVRAAVSNDCEYSPDGVPTWTFRRPAVTVSALPRGAQVDVRVHTAVPQRTVTVLMNPKSLVLRHRVDVDSLPETLRQLVDGRLAGPETLLSMPVDADIAGLVNDLTHTRLSGTLLAMQIQGRTAELLALVIQSWKDRLEVETWVGARGREGELIAAARRILCERFANPPTLHDLARQLGTNKNKLNQLFRIRFGVTPQAFCLQRRMERAQSLILEGRLNVGQVADEVGYQHQSSFAVAFRDVIGVSPREYARQHRDVAESSLALH